MATIPFYTLSTLHAEACKLVQITYDACMENDKINGFCPELDPAFRAACEARTALWNLLRVHPDYIKAMQKTQAVES